jgi:conjugal transfer pilus assembly protein TraW
VWLLLCGNAHSKNLGVFGPTYLIKEMDAFEWIVNKKLPELERSGVIDKMNMRLAENSRNRIENPKGILLPQATIMKKRLQPLIYTLARDIKDADGHVLFKKGTTTRPSDILPNSKKMLLFIDGNSKQQVNYALKQLDLNKSIKIVLVSGQPLELMRFTKIVIYFDQAQRLINRFLIKALPAKVYREESNLIIEEIVI